MTHARYIIVDSERSHALMLRRALRTGDRAEIDAAGITDARAVWRSFSVSILCRTAFVDGEIAAMWGLGGTLMAERGSPWLLTTPAVEKVPFAMVREAKKHAEEMLAVRPYLANYVHARYTRAVRLLHLIGFTVSEPFPFGPRGEMFCKFEMRAPALARSA